MIYLYLYIYIWFNFTLEFYNRQLSQKQGLNSFLKVQLHTARFGQETHIMVQLFCMHLDIHFLVLKWVFLEIRKKRSTGQE